MEVEQPHKIVVSLWLDDYDNIFSDFDPRAYSHRALSDDFLNEAKKVTYEIAPGVLDLTFLIPAAVRDQHHEKIIVERLHSHFRKVAGNLDKEYKNVVKKGIFLVLFGLFSMMAATYFSIIANVDFLMHLFKVFFEPVGWFTTWYGLDLLFYKSKESRQELLFSRKMVHAKIEFDTYKAQV